MANKATSAPAEMCIRDRLRDMMEDEKAVAELFGEMDVSEVEELLQKVMLYADLEEMCLRDSLSIVVSVIFFLFIISFTTIVL